MNFTTNHSFVLASGSPRRKELFGMLQVPFEIITADVDERSVVFETEEQFVQDVALLKTEVVAKQQPGKIVIGADTIVSFNGRLLHKPESEQEAVAHLQALSGQTHTVLTAVIIIDAEQQVTKLVEKTFVTFKHLSEALIHAYVATKDPFDKAGGYGIQTSGALLVEKIDGDYNNVVGLPIAALTAQLLSLNYLSI